jgi:hypothetical protein
LRTRRVRLFFLLHRCWCTCHFRMDKSRSCFN